MNYQHQMIINNNNLYFFIIIILRGAEMKFRGAWAKNQIATVLHIFFPDNLHGTLSILAYYNHIIFWQLLLLKNFQDTLDSARPDP